MRLVEFFKEIYGVSRLCETRVYPKNFLSDNAKGYLCYKLKKVSKGGEVQYFFNSGSNEEMSWYGIGVDELKLFINSVFKPENILVSIPNRSEKFATDNNELFLCTGYVNLNEILIPEKNYDGYSKPPIEPFHFYFKYGFQDNGKKVVISSFHRVYENHSANLFKLKGQSDFFFDDSNMPNPRYGLLKSYVLAWINIRLHKNCSIYNDFFEPIVADRDIRGKKVSFVIRGKQNTNLTDDEFDVLKDAIKRSKFNNLYDIKSDTSIKRVHNNINNATDIVVELKIKGDEI